MWIRYNPALKYYEKSDNNGASWSQLPLSASSITEGTFPPGVGITGNIAYTDKSNLFTLDQYIQTSYYPSLIFSNISLPVDSKNWWIRNTNAQTLEFHAINDANTLIQSVPLALTRDGSARIAVHLTAMNGTIRAQGARGAPPGSGPGIELFYQGQGFLHCYDINAGTYPPIMIYTSGGVNVSHHLAVGTYLTVGQYISSTGVMYPGRVDGSGLAQTAWYIAGHSSYGLYSNTGLYLAGGIWTGTHGDFGTSVRARAWFFEENRGSPLGHWIAYAPTVTTSAGYANVIGPAYAAYCLIGKTCIYSFNVSNIGFSAVNSWIAISLPIAAATYGNYAEGSVRFDFPGYGSEPCMGYIYTPDPRIIMARAADKGTIAAYASGFTFRGTFTYQIG